MPISEVAKRNIIDLFKLQGVKWSGQMTEVDFLSRLYDLESLPSRDPRYSNAKSDILTHTISFPGDWLDGWVFDDPRFNLRHGQDDEFLRFLCETIHPLVRPDKEERDKLLEEYNRYLGDEGYKLVETKTKFGNIRYEPTGILPQTVEAIEQMKDIAQELKSEYLEREIVRMTSAIDRDPELAIGTSKEFVETICKTILKLRKVDVKGNEKLPKLVQMTLFELKPVIATGDKEVAEIVRKAVGSLVTLTHSIAELRNAHGTGHGKDADTAILEPRHAALAVNSATTLGLFLFQSYEKLQSSGNARP